MSENYVVTGLDIGNGYVKGKFRGISGQPVNIDIPSCVAGIANPPSLPDVPSNEYIADIFNRMLCRIQSPIMRDSRHWAFGVSAISSGRNLTEFDIAGNVSKALQDLSSALVLGSVAGSALRNYWDEYGQLPIDILHVTAQAALALPISEYMSHRDMFAKKFTDAEHVVTICNFEKPIQIHIQFEGVNVMPEGVSAQYAIVAKGEKFIEALLDDVRAHGIPLEGITAADVINCVDTCGIDIGEGTVNLPVIKNGRFNSIASETIDKGYGSVLEQALPTINKPENNLHYADRKSLAEFIQQPVTAFNKRKKVTVNDIVASEAVDLVDRIGRAVSRIMDGGGIEVIYVYGGGATPMKDLLYNELVKKTQTFAGGDVFPILYLDSQYARNLNREGLYSIALADFEAKHSVTIQ